MNTTKLKHKPRKKDVKDLDPLSVRAALMMRGESIASWARTHEVDRTMAWRAINHPHRGRVSNYVRETLRRELGL
jgi:hypothetical protein